MLCYSNRILTIILFYINCIMYHDDNPNENEYACNCKYIEIQIIDPYQVNQEPLWEIENRFEYVFLH
jgi:hypothetical protein